MILSREVIQKSLNKDSSKFWDFAQVFGPQLSIFYYLVLVCSILNENLKFIFFPGKI